ncbi:MAG: hypothetical protein CMI08_15915 [Oceanospirillaceae bacterium]|uniref:hypothetical protein n=1 Tax=unclassified Thalassolituus TaxID=2624967 RepID=UPI000C0A32AB|nr:MULTISPECIES: hypothetical protein [unclassified Thalassolituus]MAK89932.1 hypothetical protein [Thalassolituus sp.]MAS25133.1 hypothetical protein [Oceanospirillaceae bacterium]MAY00652.1 hypothetical protein [Oceanospirillaceae bacterium]MBL36305.1 hypothetical protein [Oceanospirillaceae bacterium]MBS53992.1 hypothetical protein [Oceanospirillaceae bacterium]|tara:strand:- start:3967 stop:4494 length:528 start_codon:yes stop_codon:yes gene_type:complete
MVRVKQWESENRLSYLMIEPISRRSALVDVYPDQQEECLNILQMRGLHNAYLLYTFNHEFNMDIPGVMIKPDMPLPEKVLPLGETHIERLQNSTQEFAAYVCEGHVFSGEWWLPFALRQIGADGSCGKSVMLPLANLPDDHILHPGRVISGIRISTVRQEKAFADNQNAEVFIRG